MKHQASTSQDRPGSVLERGNSRIRPEPTHPRSNRDITATLITDLPFGPRAAEVAREAIAVALHGEAATELLDDARLVGSELATNAFTSGTPPLVLCVDHQRPSAGRLEVEITVTDGGCSLPVTPPPPEPPDEAESGRGLVIVEALADSWSLTTSVHGSRAWCRLSRSVGKH
ncbi:ATP-binding protein [Streptomyces sp. NPDC018000]|uniref:ATP-binding protein n=1 Tax=Streptomyces sp. NPDC018000 TaxID=3365028 RepID=UPI00379DF51E